MAETFALLAALSLALVTTFQVVAVAQRERS
jgi:hypothetical protein